MYYKDLSNLSRRNNKEGYVIYCTPSKEVRYFGHEDAIIFKTEYKSCGGYGVYTGFTFVTKAGALSACRSLCRFYLENDYEVMEINEAIARLKARYDK